MLFGLLFSFLWSVQCNGVFSNPQNIKEGMQALDYHWRELDHHLKQELSQANTDSAIGHVDALIQISLIHVDSLTSPQWQPQKIVEGSRTSTEYISRFQMVIELLQKLKMNLQAQPSSYKEAQLLLMETSERVNRAHRRF